MAFSSMMDAATSKFDFKMEKTTQNFFYAN